MLPIHSIQAKQHVWAYAQHVSTRETTGKSCGFCDKGSKAVYNHYYKSSEHVEKAMSKDKALEDEFHENSEKVVEQQQEGAAGTMRRHQWSNKRFTVIKDRTTKLAKPKDGFMPSATYRKQHGSVTDKANRNAGHNPALIKGTKGVLLSTDDTMWTIKQSYSSTSWMQEEIGSRHAEHLSEHDVDKTFDDLAAIEEKKQSKLSGNLLIMAFQ